MSTLQEFEDFTIEQAEEDKKNLKTGKFMKLAPGANLVRFLPAPKGGRAFRIYWQHFVNKSDGSKFSFGCPARTKPITGACPVCAHASKIEAERGKDAAKAFYPRRRIVANVIDRNDEEAGPKILDMPMQVYNALLEMRKNLGEDGNFTNPGDGFDIIISRSGTGQNDTEYTVTGARKSSPLHEEEEVWRKWVFEEATDTAAYIAPRTEEEIRSALMGNGTADRGKGKQLKAAPEPEADDDEFSDDFED